MPDNNLSAEALSLSESLETILLPVPALKMLLEVVGRQDKIIQELAARLDQDELHFSRQIAEDRKRLSILEAPKITPAEKDRSEVLRVLLAANGGKMLAKDARHKMNLSDSQFSQILAKAKDEIEVKPLNSNKRMNLLVLKSAKHSLLSLKI